MWKCISMQRRSDSTCNRQTWKDALSISNTFCIAHALRSRMTSSAFHTCVTKSWLLSGRFAAGSATCPDLWSAFFYLLWLDLQAQGLINSDSSSDCSSCLLSSTILMSSKKDKSKLRCPAKVCVCVGRRHCHVHGQEFDVCRATSLPLEDCVTIGECLGFQRCYVITVPHLGLLS